MLQFDVYYEIADNIFTNTLGLSDDHYKTFTTNADVKEFTKKYLNDENYIRGLVIDELANYDTSENNPAEIEDITENAISELFYRIDDITEKYYRIQHQATLNVYREIVSAIDNIVGVESVDSDYELADPDVGIYNESRSIEVRLTNGSTIYMEVEISEE